MDSTLIASVLSEGRLNEPVTCNDLGKLLQLEQEEAD